MLVRHTAYYVLSLGVPGLINLLSISIFTRMLAPEDYGQYALVIAGTGLMNAVLFRWINLGLLRFYVANQSNREVFLSTIFAAYLVVVGLAGLLGLAGLFAVDEGSRTLLALGLWLLWLMSFFELNKELARSQFLPKRYGGFTLVKAILSLGVGALLVSLGFGAAGLLCGGMFGILVPLIWVFHKEWRCVRLRHVDRSILSQLLAYGLPLTAAYALGFIVSSSDRFLIGWLLDTEATGLYSVGFDLAKQSLSMGMMVVNLAAYPLAVKALEQHGVEQARAQLKSNIVLLLVVAMPSTFGVVLLAPNIAQVFLGAMFRDAAVTLMPWIAIGALIAGVKAYHCDLSFQLERHTQGQVWVTMVAAVVNVALNLWWIPRYGVLGAAYSNVAAYTCGIFCSLYLGRKLFVVPWPFREIFKIVTATLCMALALVPFLELRGGGALALQVGCGIAVFILAGWFLDIGGFRVKILKSGYFPPRFTPGRSKGNTA